MILFSVFGEVILKLIQIPPDFTLSRKLLMFFCKPNQYFVVCRYLLDRLYFNRVIYVPMSSQ